MLKRLLSIDILAGCISLTTGISGAKEVMHAVCGTVSAVNSTTRTITVITDEGSDGTFTQDQADFVCSGVRVVDIDTPTGPGSDIVRMTVDRYPSLVGRWPNTRIKPSTRLLLGQINRSNPTFA